MQQKHEGVYIKTKKTTAVLRFENMIYNHIYNNNIGSKCRYAVAKPEDGLVEVHAIVEVEPKGDGFDSQVDRLHKAVKELEAAEEMQSMQAVVRRYFLSDAVNQKVKEDGCRCATSYIGQAPLNGSKVALWIYYVGKDAEVVYDADELGSTVVRYKGLTHVWTMNMMVAEGSSYDQTHALLEKYEALLKTKYGTTMEKNCVRTWFFVKDVDTQYRGLVVARKELFEQMGMTPETHYIASTGIGGTPTDQASLVQMGCYALIADNGAVDSKYLYAPTHLNKTYEYGVTFERGTTLKMAERQTSLISGTASINNKGQVVHVGDVVAQTHRMWENVEALLKEAEMTMENVLHMVVYLRDPADYEVVSRLFEERFPQVPRVITLAPVCRPQWLIEMEVMAVRCKR